MTEITPWHWIGFIICILVFLALDLGVLNRRERVVKFKEALAWSALWFSLAMLFAGLLAYWRNHEEAVEFVTGYVIEYSLSLDNIFVIAVIFSYFQVAPESRHRLLFWGVLGALVMRGIMILAGIELIRRFGWILYLLGAFLVFTGSKMFFSGGKPENPEDNFAIRFTKKFFPKFMVNQSGKGVVPFIFVLFLIEFTDLIFALDSIPAIFAVTTKPFVVFTSNVFAILGLRSLYFVLAEAIDYFRYLKTGLAAVLVFVGVKMLLSPHGREPQWFQVEIPTLISLLVIAGIFLTCIVLSVIVARREKLHARTD
ncbi:MAG TPA: TerC family protein [Verrucomicrobiae bacterium]|nr:TerC family protein [Verrucomicrobiae bacterium]